MNIGTTDSTVAPDRRGAAPAADELTRTKQDLLKAEVRLAKARATIATAEIDVRVLTARLRALAK